jgi:molybdate transport system substrate-binding protein
MRARSTIALGLGLAFASASPTMVTAADISLFASSAIDAILEELVPGFERTAKHKVAMRLDYASLLRQQIEAGAPFDVAILVGNLDELVKQGKIAAGTPTALGRSAYGLAVRRGAPKPDIGTTEAFKRTMLGATSVGYSRDGGSGAYFVRLLERLGIAEEMKPKLRPGANTQDAVASGEIEMSVNGIVPILRASGIELVGPLPAELQSYSTFVAGISAATKEKEAATALLTYLASPTSIETFRKRGVLPAQ